MSCLAYASEVEEQRIENRLGGQLTYGVRIGGWSRYYRFGMKYPMPGSPGHTKPSKPFMTLPPVW